MSVFDIRWSSRVLKLSAHGLSYTPSPGQGIFALSSLLVNTPAGSPNAAASWVFAVPGSTLTMRSAKRVCELRPLGQIAPVKRVCAAESGGIGRLHRARRIGQTREEGRVDVLLLVVHRRQRAAGRVRA